MSFSIVEKDVPNDAPAEFRLRQEEYSKMRMENPTLAKTVAYRPGDKKFLVEAMKTKKGKSFFTHPLYCKLKL
jgi:hypothetical protein